MDPVSQLSQTSLQINNTRSDAKVSKKSLFDSMVVLLNSNDSNDDYIQEIQSKCSQNTFEFIEMCPIQFNYINARQLFEALLSADKWSAICVTSKRCVDALRLAINSDSSSNVTDLWHKFNNRVFVVGIKSYEYLKATFGWEAIGSDCGNSHNLAQLMINEFKHELCAKPVLFPCSQLRNDSLPQSLRNAGIVVNEIVVYQTVPNSQLASKVNQLSNRLIDCLENRVSNALKLILIFFSPSGFQSFHPFLNEYIVENKGFNNKLEIKYVAIGDTMGSALRKSSLNVWFTSPKPNPKSLAQTMSEKLKILNDGSEVSAQTQTRGLAQQKHENSNE